MENLKSVKKMGPVFGPRSSRD